MKLSLFTLSIFLVFTSIVSSTSQDQAFVYAQDPSILKEHEDVIKEKLKELQIEQEIQAQRERERQAEIDAENEQEDKEEETQMLQEQKSDKKKLILESDELSWQWKYIKDVPEPPKKGYGEASKSDKKEYEDFFGNSNKNKKQKNKPTKKPKKYRKGAKLNPKEMRDPYDAGLPSVIVAHIDEEYAEKHMKSGKINIGAKFGQNIEIDAGPEEAGKYMCEEIARKMAVATDIESENQYYNEKHGTCVFQVIMDSNADEVVDWLEEQKYVVSIEYNAPMDKIDPMWGGV